MDFGGKAVAVDNIGPPISEKRTYPKKLIKVKNSARRDQARKP